MKTHDDNTTNATTASATDALGLLDKLHQEQVNWSATLYKTAQDKLIALLSECMTAHKLLKDDDKQRKLFNARMKALNIDMRAGTDLSTRIVRYVFRITGGRMHAYARVIREALAADREPTQLATWVADRGGIEGVRASKVAKAAEQELDDATTALEHAGAVVSINKLDTALQPGSSGYGNFTLLLVRHDKSTGNGEVVWGSDNAALIKRYIGRVAKQVLEKHQAELEAVSVPARRLELQAALHALPFQQVQQVQQVQVAPVQSATQIEKEEQEKQAA